jgi:hypothetical protein
VIPTFSIHSKENTLINEAYETAMQDLNEFFDIKWAKDTPKIFIVDDRKTIDSFLEKETPAWSVGWTWTKNAIIILNPDNIAQESTHKYNEDDIKKLIKHELCHCFYRSICYHTKPNWLTEGTSLFIADQLDKYKVPDAFSKFLTDERNYNEAGFAIKLLVDTFGKNKFLEFLKSIKGINQDEGIFEKFEYAYNSKPTYEFFNHLLSANNLG